MFKRIKLEMIYWLARRLPDCKAITRMASDEMERRLELKQRIQMRLHLLICTACARYKDQLMMIRDSLRRRSEELMLENLEEGTLSAEARERMKRML